MESIRPSIAGLYPRTVAWVLDLVFIAMVVTPIGAVLHLGGFVAAGGGISDSGGWFSLLAVLASAPYCIGFWATIAATPGQLIMNVRVHRISDRQMLSVDRAAVRWFLLFGVFGLIGAVEVVARGTSGLLLLVQGLWAGFLFVSTLTNPARQGLHDLYAGSVVDKSRLAALLSLLTPQAVVGQVMKNFAPPQPQAWASGPPPSPEAPATPDVAAVPRIASMWPRTAAFLLDLIPILVISGTVGRIANVPGVATPTGYAMSSSGWSMVLVAIVSAVYCIGSWATIGATPGQWLMRLRVCTPVSFARLGVLAAVARWALLWGVLCALGALAIPGVALAYVSFPGQLAWLIALVVTAGRSSTKQGIHDQLAQSVVVRS
jgi:uncharacterized RDD family membrane protein YckC